MTQAWPGRASVGWKGAQKEGGISGNPDVRYMHYTLGSQSLCALLEDAWFESSLVARAK